MQKVLILIFYLSCLPIFASEVTQEGNTAAGFLNIGTSARIAGMGDAFMANDNDVTGVYWNPASLARVDNSQLVYGYGEWLADIDLDYVSGMLSFGRYGALAFHWTRLSLENMERTMTAQPVGTDKNLDASSTAFGFSYAYPLLDRLALGFTYKRIEEQIYHSTARGNAFDLGVLYCVPFYAIQLGMSYANWGSKIKMEGQDMLTQVDLDPAIGGNNPFIHANQVTEAYDLPRTFRFHAAVDVLKSLAWSNLNIAFAGMKPYNEEWFYNPGFEYIFYNTLYLRRGFIDYFKNNANKTKCTGIGFRYCFLDLIAFKFDFSRQNFDIEDFDLYSLGAELKL